MPKIPVADETVPFSGAMMPGSSGGGYTAVGDAVKGFGNAISDVGMAFAAKTEQEDDYQDKLSLLDWQNGQSIDAIKAQREYNQDDPTGFATQRHGAREQSFRNDLVPKLRTEKGRKQAEVFWRGTGHNFYEGDFRFEQGQREQKIFRDTGRTISGMFEALNTKTPEEAEQAVLRTFDGVDAIIKKYPMSPERKEVLAKESAQLGLAYLRAAYTDAEGRTSDRFKEAAQRMMKAQGIDPNAQPTQPGPSAASKPFPVGGSMAGKTMADVPSDGGRPNSRNFLGPRATGAHGGLDIPGKTGDPVLAVGDGVVVKIGNDPSGYGPYIDVRYADGTVHRSAHLGNDTKGGKVRAYADGMKEGVKVKAGQPIGFLGYSGNAGSEFPHVHYEVFHPGAYERTGGGGSSRSAEGRAARMDPRKYFDGLSNASAPSSPGGSSDPDVTRRISVQEYFGPSVDVSKLPLGMRVSHNPMNIKYSGSKFQKEQFVGLEGPSKAKDEGDPQAQFANPVAGVASGVRLAALKYSQGMDTPAKIIAGPMGWTPGYAAAAEHIAKLMGVGPNDKIDLSKPEVMSRFVRAVITQEHGPSGKLYDDKVIARGVAVAMRGNSPVRVADASGAIPQSAGGAAPGGGAQYGGGVKGQFTELLIRGMPQFAKEAEVAQERWAKGIEGQAKTILDLADKGYATSDQVDQVRKAIAERPDIAARFGIDKASAALDNYVGELNTMRVMTPTELQATISDVDRNIRAAPPGTPPEGIAQAVKRKERMTALLSNMSKEINEDPISWGDRVGLVPLTKLDLSSPRGIAEGMPTRIAAAKAIAERYGQDVQFFTKAERDQLAKTLKQGGEPMLLILGRMSQELGPDMINAMGEVAKEAPTAATIGWMMTQGLSVRTIEDAALGMERQTKRQDGQKSIAPVPEVEARAAFVDTFGTAFRRRQAAEGALMETTRAIYEVRAQRLALKVHDPELFKSILKEVAGENTDARGETYGGVYNQRGSHPIIVPTNMRKSSFPEVLDAIYSVDELVDTRKALQTVRTPDGKWAGARSPWLEEKNPRDIQASSTLTERVLADGPESYVVKRQPTDDQGRPLSIGALRRATLVNVGDGKYLMATGDLSAADPRFVQDGHGEPYVLDLKQLEPILRQRRPDLYKGYTDPVYTMPSMVAP